MFPPKAEDQFHPDLKWYPIPVHTIPIHQDHILYVERHCERLKRAMDQYFASETYKKEFEQFRPLSDYLEKHSGFKILNFTSYTRLYDTLRIEKHYNKT